MVGLGLIASQVVILAWPAPGVLFRPHSIVRISRLSLVRELGRDGQTAGPWVRLRD